MTRLSASRPHPSRRPEIQIQRGHQRGQPTLGHIAMLCSAHLSSRLSVNGAALLAEALLVEPPAARRLSTVRPHDALSAQQRPQELEIQVGPLRGAAVLPEQRRRAQTDHQLRADVERHQRPVLAMQLTQVLAQAASQLQVRQVTIADGEQGLALIRVWGGGGRLQSLTEKVAHNSFGSLPITKT